MRIDHEGYIVAREDRDTSGWLEFFDGLSSWLIKEKPKICVFPKKLTAQQVHLLWASYWNFGLFFPLCISSFTWHISYYVGLGQRQDELLDVENSVEMPHHLVLGGLAALGQLTFFSSWSDCCRFGNFDLTGLLHYFALIVAVLLVILGAFMLTGGRLTYLDSFKNW